MSRSKILAMTAVVFFVFGMVMMGSTIAGELFPVSGQITFPGSGNVFIGLFNQEEETTGKTPPQERFIVIKLSPEQIKRKTTSFSLAAVPGGEYCIKSFQDNNGNGKFDQGIWATPEEPYGFYRSCFPFSWDAAKFKVYKEIHGIDISLH